MSFCQFFEPAVGGSFQPFRRGRRAGQLPLFSGPSAKGGVLGGRSRLAALDPTVHCRSRSPLLRCRGWHGLRPSHHLRPPLLLHPRPFAAVCQGGTGDPRLPCTQSPPLRRHPLARGGMSPRAAPARLATQARSHRPNRLRSPLRPCHPPKSPIWWTKCLFVSVIHKNGSFGG